MTELQPRLLHFFITQLWRSQAARRMQARRATNEFAIQVRSPKDKPKGTITAPDRFRAKREHLQTVQGLLSESQSQNLALTVLHVPHSLDGGRANNEFAVQVHNPSILLSSLEFSDTNVDEP